MQKEDYELINSYLNSYIKETKVNGFTFFLDYLNYLTNISKELKNYNINYHKVSFQKYVSKEETFELANEFLKQIDPNLLNKLKELINNKQARFVDKTSLDYSKMTVDNFEYYENGSGLDRNNKCFINLVLNNDVADIFFLIHELSHIGNLKENIITNSYFMLTEGYAFYFEILLLKFLKKIKWNNEEVNKYYEMLILSLYSRNINFFYQSQIIKLFIDKGNLNDTTIKNSKIRFVDNILEVLLDDIKSEDVFFNNDPFYDSKYSLGIVYCASLLENHNIDTFLEEYYNLQSTDLFLLLKKHLDFDKVYHKTKTLNNLMKFKV